MQVSSFFKAEGIRAALNSYRLARPNWDIQHKLDLYNSGKRAFDLPGQLEDRKKAFANIYDSLNTFGSSGWNTFRGAEHFWKADQIFDALETSFEPFSRRAGTRLSTLDSSDYNKLWEALQTLRSIKEVKDPTMAMSKFLHFFNPMLFPMWDTAIIYHKVVGPHGIFNREYKSFVSTLPTWVRELDRDSDYYLRYVAWASSIVLSGPPSPVMSSFADWVREQASSHPENGDVVMELDRYEATAFEFAVIGAALS
jgi:hypothetical protein